MALIICVVGKGRASGKTHLVETLTAKFTSESFKVATVKHLHRQFDSTDKDTWRHLEAGATTTVAATPTEIITMRRRKAPSLDEVLKTIEVDVDLVFVEGYKKSQYPKILAANTASEALAAMKDVSKIIGISGLIAGKPKEQEILKAKHSEIKVLGMEEAVSAVKEMLTKDILESLPGLNCGHCGRDTCLALAQAITAGDATKNDCQVLSTDLVALEVDGKIVPLSKFPQQILKGVTMGVLSNLRGVDGQPKHIKIKIKAE
jgi:molybdopterin-guanine dinucleotide biosynthesis protein B